jgi:hypothetical protein
MFTYSILKSVLGSFHQGNDQFGETAGRQCVCNALFSIYWSNVVSVPYWNKIDLNQILIQGDSILQILK